MSTTEPTWKTHHNGSAHKEIAVMALEVHRALMSTPWSLPAATKLPLKVTRPPQWRELR